MRSTTVAILLVFATTAHAEPPGMELLRPDAATGLADHLGLPNLDVLPTYSIDLAIDDVSGHFTGHLTLDVVNLTGAPMAELPLVLPTNTSSELGSETAGSMRVTSVATVTGPTATASDSDDDGDGDSTVVDIALDPPLPARSAITLSVRYEGELGVLPDSTNDAFEAAMGALGTMSGSTDADYGLMAMGDGIVTMAGAYPMLAPFHDGAFQRPSPSGIGDIAYGDMAHYRLRVIVPSGLTVVTSLVDTPAETAPDGASSIVRAEGAMVRDLVVVCGRDLVSVERQLGATRVRSVFRERDRRAGERALDIAASSLETFEATFGPYPYTELDVVEATLGGGAGGVEFSGMVLIAGMLYRPLSESRSELAVMLRMYSSMFSMLDAQLGVAGAGGGAGGGSLMDLDTALDETLDFTVAHEVAHQYFAGLVGSDAHSAPWIDEPLAQYAAGLAISARDGEAAAERAMNMNVKANYALYRLLGGDDRAVRRGTSEYGDTIEYAALVYGKAPYFYLAVRDAVGAETLNRAIASAVADHRFTIVSPDAWFETLTRETGGASSPVPALVTRWFDESHGDADLGVDSEGRWLIRNLLPPGMASDVEEMLMMMGMTPRDLVGMLTGDLSLGATGGNLGFDPSDALQMLEALGQ